MQKYFTLTEAQALIPRVRPLLQAAVDANQRMMAAEEGLGEIRRRVNQLGGVRPDRPLAIELKMKRESAAEELRSSVEAIQEFDVQVKDLNLGLIDFPTRYRGREVLLCYRLGEASIAYWHETDAGFGGRQEIDEDFLEHHEGDGDP